MNDAGIKTHLVLHRDFGASETVAENNNRRPQPLHNLILNADHPSDCATYTLLEGSLRYYPLELEDFMRSDVLRVQYKVTTKNMEISTRFTRDELDAQEKLLVPFSDEAVAAWNIVQLRAAKILMDNAPAQDRAVSLSVIESFCKNPHSFYNALTARPAPGLRH